MLGGGAIYAYNNLKKTAEEGEAAEVATNADGNIKVADVDDNLPFKEAFDSARAQAGAGGCFRWHGGIYSTYTEDEWNGMSNAEKNAYSQAIRPEVRADELVAERMAGQEHASEESTNSQHADNEENPTPNHHDANMHQASWQPNGSATAYNQPQTANDDIHVVGQDNIGGHQTLFIDADSDGKADVALIDVDNSGTVSDPDVVVASDGSYATIGQLGMAEGNQSDVMATETSPSTDDGTVRVVSQGYLQGHQAVGLDVTGNGDADVALIDVDDSHSLNSPDVAVDLQTGESATVAEIVGEQESPLPSDRYYNTEEQVDTIADPNLPEASMDDKPIETQDTEFDDGTSLDGSGMISI